MSECKTASCENPKTQTEQCPVEKAISEGCCPIEASIGTWKSSFATAMKETQVEILKSRIKKNWGPLMEKEGDAIIAAVGTHWQSMLAQAKAKQDVKEAFKKIFEEGCK